MRYIPARAGNTAARPCPRAASPGHPRAPRGERLHGPVPDLAANLRYIPARAGTPRVDELMYDAIDGTSPRAAGNTIGLGPLSGAGLLHRRHRGPTSPRARGALRGSRAARRGARSTSPRAREHPVRRARSSCRCGTSPRARGARQFPRRLYAITAVHPRARGEHHAPLAEDQLRAHGTSPRARGTHPPERMLGGAGRYIPARAGNTFAVPR